MLTLYTNAERRRHRGAGDDVRRVLDRDEALGGESGRFRIDEAPETGREILCF
jgi:hypothetical protein